MGATWDCDRWNAWGLNLLTVDAVYRRRAFVDDDDDDLRSARGEADWSKETCDGFFEVTSDFGERLSNSTDGSLISAGLTTFFSSSESSDSGTG